MTTPPPLARRHRWIYLGLGMVMLVVLIAAVVSEALPANLGAAGSGTPSSSPPGPPVVNILPSHATKSDCVTQGPNQTEEQLPLHNGTIQTNLYKPPNGTVGAVGECYSSGTGSLFSYVNWSAVGGKGGWYSYPQITYGVDYYEGPTDTYTNQSSMWTLPKPVSSVVNNGLWVTASYSYHPPPTSIATGDDISFDNYLSDNSPPTFESGTPWVEVLVLLAHTVWNHPSEWISWNMTTLVNSTLSVQPWAIGYWCHSPTNGSSSNITFDFSYDGSPKTTLGLYQGTLGVNLSAVLAEVEVLAPHATCWTGTGVNVGSLYLGQEVFGAEAGVHTNGSFDFDWTDDQYCIHPSVRVPTALGVECGVASPGPPSIFGAGASGGGAVAGAPGTFSPIAATRSRS
jgi:hypothetical protein